MKYLYVAGKTGDALLLHVSASSEEEEVEKKTGIKKQGTKRQNVKLFITMELFPHFY